MSFLIEQKKSAPISGNFSGEREGHSNQGVIAVGLH